MMSRFASLLIPTRQLRWTYVATTVFLVLLLAGKHHISTQAAHQSSLYGLLVGHLAECKEVLDPHYDTQADDMPVALRTDTVVYLARRLPVRDPRLSQDLEAFAVRFRRWQRDPQMGAPAEELRRQITRLRRGYNAEALRSLSRAESLRNWLLGLMCLIIVGQIFFLFVPIERRMRLYIRELIRSHQESQAAEEEARSNFEALQQTQQQLETANRQLNQLSLVARNTDNAVIITNAQRQIEWVNEGFVRLTGYSLNEAIGRTPGSLLQGPDTDPDTVAYIRQMLAAQKPLHTEILNYSKSQKAYWVSLNINPVFDDEGQLQGFIAVELDVTIARERTRRIEELLNQITDSIHYAERIQKAIMPEITEVRRIFPESFVLFAPRDVVSGDFYLVLDRPGLHKRFVACADCTGHGIPGAFLSMLAANQLYQIIQSYGMTAPELILEELHRSIRKILRQDANEIRDGLDVGICVVTSIPQTYNFLGGATWIEYAGAMHSLYRIEDGELIEAKGDRLSVGGHHQQDPRHYHQHRFALTGPMMLYMATDGYQDQLGGPNRRKFLGKNFRQLLTQIAELPVQTQHQLLEQKHQHWKAHWPQTDDITIIGFRL